MATPEQRPRRVPASLLTIEEAAERLNVDVQWLRRHVSQRTVRHYKLGRHLRFDPADLDALILNGCREAVR
jgi:excisionase family DNA binding protein